MEAKETMETDLGVPSDNWYGRKNEAVMAGIAISRSSGIGLARILMALEAGDPDDTAERWSGRPLTELVNHIEDTHHLYVRRELPILEKLAAKIARVPGDHQWRFLEISTILGRFRKIVGRHMKMEETIIFPCIRAMEREGAINESVMEEVREMNTTQEEARMGFIDIRLAIRGQALPEEARPDYLEFFFRLEKFEDDMAAHLAKEYDILFPRVAKFESQIKRDMAA